MENSKGKKVVLILIILLLLVLIVAGGAYAYIATDLFKSDEQLFKKYLVSGVLEISKFNSEPYEEAFERMDKEPAEITLTTKMDDEDYQNQETKLVLKTDIPNRNEALSLNVKVDDEDYMSADLLITDNTYGVHFDGLHDKYIAVENKDLKKLAKNLGAEDEVIEFIPDTIPDTFISKEEQKKLADILTKYLNKLSEKIDVNSYKQEKYTIEEFDGEKFEGNKYTLEIATEKYKYDFCDILKEFTNDEEVLNLLEGKLSEKTIEKIKEFDLEESLDIKDERQDFDKNDFTQEDNNLKVSLYSYKGKTIKLDFYVDNELAYELYVLNKDNSSHIKIKEHDPKTEYNKVASVDITEMKNTFENNVGEFLYETQTKYNEDDLNALETEDNAEEDSYSSFSSYMDKDWYKEREENSKTSMKLTTKIENDVITSKLSSDDEILSIPNVNLKIRFGSDIKVPTLSSDKMIVVNDYTEEDFSKLGEEFTQNIKKTAEENPNSYIGYIYEMMNYKNSIDNIDLDNDFSGDLTSDITTSDNSSEDELSYEKDFVNSEIEYAINSVLTDYKNDLESDENTNIGDYLNGDRIANQVSMFVENLEIIDGTTIRCNYHEKTFFTKININGESFVLENAETLYSEDGTLESAK